MTVNVLGTEYVICHADYEDDPSFEQENLSAYCLFPEKQIVIGNLKTFPAYKNDSSHLIEKTEKLSLRHEIVHAFLYESGLNDSANSNCGAWARNEEMVDWFALQGLKLYEAWKQANAI